MIELSITSMCWVVYGNNPTVKNPRHPVFDYFFFMKFTYLHGSVVPHLCLFIDDPPARPIFSFFSSSLFSSLLFSFPFSSPMLHSLSLLHPLHPPSLYPFFCFTAQSCMGEDTPISFFSFSLSLLLHLLLPHLHCAHH